VVISRVSLDIPVSAKHLESAQEVLHNLSGSFGYVAPEVLSNLGHGKPVDMWSTGCVVLSGCRCYVSVLICANIRIISYVLLCGYSPFRSEDPQLLVKETIKAQIEFHDQYWRNISSEGACSRWLMTDCAD
jgi:calcium/calmodulin-dependent protein kinase I